MKHALVMTLAVSLVFVMATGLRAEEPAKDAEKTAVKLDAAADARVKKLISDGGYYYSVGQFDKARECAEAALRINADSASAKQLKEMCDQTVKAKADRPTPEERAHDPEVAIARVEHEMAAPREILRLPDNWDEVKKRRGGVSGEAVQVAEENREVNAKLDSISVNMDFNATSLKEAAGFLANAGKVNITVDPRAKAGDKAAPDIEVTFKAADMKLRHALTWITKLNGLVYTVRDQAVLITDKEHLEDFKVTAVYDVSDLVDAIPDYSSVPEFDMTLPAINARRISDGFYRVPYFWDAYGTGVFTGAYFLDFAVQNRQFITEDELQELIDRLIQAEEAK